MSVGVCILETDEALEICIVFPLKLLGLAFSCQR